MAVSLPASGAGGRKFESCRAHVGSVSVPVCPATRQDPNDIHHACLAVALETYSPVSHPQAPFVGIRQLDDIAGRWVVCEPVKRADDATLDRPVETLEVTSCSR